ncbi:MAG TPA: phosphatase PAP2 family protein, partial [Candidatus Cloacimonadota bacterium]|nr:phosphatase PAP2 family protein [Candidatus Cloacimonadota bacterium]
EENRGNSFWNGSGITRKRDSFPSGHSMLVWSIAPIVADQYRETRWVPVLAYSLASLTSLSRVYDDKHWSSDVFAGALIGYLAGKLTLASTPRFSLHPGINGVSFSYSFGE